MNRLMILYLAEQKSKGIMLNNINITYRNWGIPAILGEATVPEDDIPANFPFSAKKSNALQFFAFQVNGENTSIRVIEFGHGHQGDNITTSHAECGSIHPEILQVSHHASSHTFVLWGWLRMQQSIPQQ
jgi:hypothetical protein